MKLFQYADYDGQGETINTTLRYRRPCLFILEHRALARRRIQLNNVPVRELSPEHYCAWITKSRLTLAIHCGIYYMSLSCRSTAGAVSALFFGSSLCSSSGSAGSWRVQNLMNHRNIPTWFMTSRVPLARSIGSVALDDGRRTFGPNTVAKLFCPILFCSWCSLNLSRKMISTSMKLNHFAPEFVFTQSQKKTL